MCYIRVYAASRWRAAGFGNPGELDYSELVKECIDPDPERLSGGGPLVFTRIIFGSVV